MFTQRPHNSPSSRINKVAVTERSTTSRSPFATSRWVQRTTPTVRDINIRQPTPPDRSARHPLFHSTHPSCRASSPSSPHAGTTGPGTSLQATTPPNTYSHLPTQAQAFEMRENTTEFGAFGHEVDDFVAGELLLALGPHGHRAHNPRAQPMTSRLRKTTSQRIARACVSSSRSSCLGCSTMSSTSSS